VGLPDADDHSQQNKQIAEGAGAPMLGEID
jgi:hypothetical protein